MTTIRTILLDDEPACLNTLQLLVERFCPTLKVVYTSTNPRNAIESVLELQPDLLLLDIEMPELSGFDVLEKTRPTVQPEVIFATAHNEYAIRAFKFTSVDYLLKPVEAAELVVAVARAEERIRLKKRSLELDFLLDNHRHAHNQPPKLALPTATGLSFVALAEVIYLEAQGAYTRFYLQGKKEVLVSRNTACEKNRPASYALRAICASPPLTRHGAAGRRPVTGRSLAALSAKKREKRPFRASMSAKAPKMDILLLRL